MPKKTDRNDARGIAQVMRSGWYRAVHVKSLIDADAGLSTVFDDECLAQNCRFRDCGHTIGPGCAVLTPHSGVGARDRNGSEILDDARGGRLLMGRAAEEGGPMTPKELQLALARFTGSDTLTRHGLTRRILMTQGVVFLAEQAQAHWLTDLIVSHQADPRVRSEPFQVWTLTVDAAERRAVATVTDGNTKQPVTRQEIPWTDFPLPAVTIWLVQEGDAWIMLLPSEY